MSLLRGSHSSYGRVIRPDALEFSRNEDVFEHHPRIYNSLSPGEVGRLVWKRWLLGIPGWVWVESDLCRCECLFLSTSLWPQCVYICWPMAPGPSLVCGLVTSPQWGHLDQSYKLWLTHFLCLQEGTLKIGLRIWRKKTSSCCALMAVGSLWATLTTVS